MQKVKVMSVNVMYVISYLILHTLISLLFVVNYSKFNFMPKISWAFHHYYFYKYSTVKPHSYTNG